MIFHLATRVPEHLEVALDPGLIVHVGVSLANSKADKRWLISIIAALLHPARPNCCRGLKFISNQSDAQGFVKIALVSTDGVLLFNGLQ